MTEGFPNGGSTLDLFGEATGEIEVPVGGSIESHSLAGTQGSLVGKTFGLLTVVEQTKVPGKNPRCYCQCECGDSKTVDYYQLLRKVGGTRSCGCLVLNPIPSGTKFGRLTVTSRVLSEDGKWRYHCSCSCGGETTTYGWCLKKGFTHSCGCFRSEKGLQPGEAGFRKVFRDYRRGALRRGILFEITEAEVATLLQQDCHYCGLPPSRDIPNRNSFGNYRCSGIDRIDNAKPYCSTNVVSACWMCNRAKGSLSRDTFLKWALSIHPPSWTPVTSVPPSKQEKAHYKGYQTAAKRRGIEILLSATVLGCYFRAPCAYCGTLPPPGKFTGVDRVDNEVGYEAGNTVAACKCCNYAKRNLPLVNFLTWADRLQAYQKASSMR